MKLGKDRRCRIDGKIHGGNGYGDWGEVGGEDARKYAVDGHISLTFDHITRTELPEQPLKGHACEFERSKTMDATPVAD